MESKYQNENMSPQPPMESKYQNENISPQPPMESKYQNQPSPQTINMVVIDVDENMSPEFENHTISYHIDDINENNAILKVNNTFKDWNEVDVIVNQHARQNGFVAIKSRKDLDEIDKTIVRRRVYTCWKSGTNKPKKVEDITSHRNATTTKTNCPWQASFYFGKRAAAIHLTKLNNVHNHQCDPITIDLALKNQRFPQEILDKIKHYTINGHISAGQQYDLLLKEFPQYHIKKKNLYNAIQKFRGV